MSDHAKVVASNQCALPVLTYYKNTKIKAAVKLYCNADSTIAAVRSFEELAVQKGRHPIINDDKKYAEELNLELWLNFPSPWPVAVADGKEVKAKKVKQAIYKARQQKIKSTRYLGIDGKESLSTTDGATSELNWRSVLCGFLDGRMPQRIPSLEYMSFTNNCYLPRFTTTEKTKSQVTDEKCRLCGNSGGRMCSTIYLVVVHWRRLSTYRDKRMLSRYCSLQSLDL